MRNQEKEAFRAAFAKEFKEETRHPFREAEMATFIRDSRENGKLTAKDIGRALYQGIMDVRNVETEEDPIEITFTPPPEPSKGKGRLLT